MAITTGQNASASDFIATSSGPSDAGKVPKVNADGVLDKTFFNQTMAFGDGSDGAVTISSPTTLTRDMFYDSLTVNDILTTNGFRIFVKNTISGSGTITYPTPNTGGNASSGSPGVGADGFNGSSYGTLLNTPGSGGGAPGSPNNAGGAAGGSGGNGLAGNAGTGTSGTGGSGGQGGGGGGSGASGGILLIAARVWAGTFTIQAIGGNGGNGGNGSTSTSGSGDGASGGNAANFRIDTANNAGTAGGNGTGTSHGVGGAGATGVGSSATLGQVFGADYFTTVNLIEINQGIVFKFKNICGACGGSGGGRGNSGSGGGSGGNGGHGGVAIVIYAQKTWTGSYVLTGGTGGTGGTASGTASAGTNGANGVTGSSYEFPVGTFQ